MKSNSQINGLIAINKPTGMTSHDVVDQIRKIINQRSVGHTGTLDPLASGLMLICLGKTTKLSRFLTNQTKTYKATVRLGLTSTTMDAEGVDSDSAQTVPDLSNKEISSVLKSFEGHSLQRVPIHSAIRVDGERLYEKARRGEEVKAPEREITIYNISHDNISLPDIAITVNVSSGTYIRSLAHDIGQKIGCGAYLKSLSRISIGSISDDQALTLEELTKIFESGSIDSSFISLDKALGFGAVIVSDEFSERISQGRKLQNNDINGLEGEFKSEDYILLKSPKGSILAVGTAHKSSKCFRDGSNGELFSYERVLV